MKKIPFLLIALFAASLLGAGVTTGVVDLERIFREYYKSKIAEELIRQQATVYRNYLKRMETEHARLAETARTARAAAQNVALSASERQRAEAKAEAAARALAAQKAEAELYARDRAADMRNLQNRKRAEILKDIREQIARSAALLGYGFVLDCSGRVPGEQGMVLLYPPGRDFTNHVITELNRNQTAAPANKGNKNK